MTPRRLTALTGGAFLAAGILTAAVIMPAELGRDPTGFGRLTGLIDLAPRAETGAVPASASEFRSDVIAISLTSESAGREGSELEYKVALHEGATVVYSWVVEQSSADEFYFDFHGEQPGNPPYVVSYGAGMANQGAGTLTAPFTGIHGWYFQNQSMATVVVYLRISGFYDLIAPGQPGNLNGLLPQREGSVR